MVTRRHFTPPTLEYAQHDLAAEHQASHRPEHPFGRLPLVQGLKHRCSGHRQGGGGGAGGGDTVGAIPLPSAPVPQRGRRKHECTMHT